MVTVAGMMEQSTTGGGRGGMGGGPFLQTIGRLRIDRRRLRELETIGVDVSCRGCNSGIALNSRGHGEGDASLEGKRDQSLRPSFERKVEPEI